MGKNKKAPANGFYYFMLDFRQRQGKNFRSMQEVADAAGVHWKNMSPDQKRPYEDAAKRERNNGVKYTSINENIDVVKKVDMAKIDRENKMKADIKNMIVTNMDLGRLADTSFYLIHINDFFYCRSDKRHYPAEVAVLRFSLNYGVLDANIYHMLVQPGRLPIGYAAEAKEKASETHQLSVPYGEDDCNLEDIMHDLRQFLKVDFNAADSSYPPLYTLEKDFAKVDNILDFLCDDYGYVREHFKLYETEQLLYNLRNREESVWPSISNAKMELDKDPYNFTNGIGCEIHETSEIGYHCSRSYVVRTAFTICDCVCPEMGIELIAGQHVPANTAETLRQMQANMSRAPSVASVATGSRYQYYGDDDAASVRSGATGYSKDKTVYSVASSVFEGFGGYESEETFGQSDGDCWNKVTSSRRKKETLQTQWPKPEVPSQSTSSNRKAAQVATFDAATAESSATFQTSQDLSQGGASCTLSEAGSKNVSQSMRRPKSVSVAQQFRNLKPPSSGVGTVGSTKSSAGGSMVKGRGRASLIFNLD